MFLTTKDIPVKLFPMKALILTLCCAIALFGDSSEAAAKKEVSAAMEAYRNAFLHGDSATLEKLLGSDLSYVHSEGSVKNKAETVQAVAAGPGPDRIEFLPDTTIRIHGLMAFAAGHQDFWENDILKHMYVLQVWEKTSQGWQMVARQATLISIEPAPGIKGAHR